MTFAVKRPNFVSMYLQCLNVRLVWALSARSLWAALNFAKVRRQLYCRAELGEYSISRMYLRILFNMSIKCHFI